MYGHALSGRAAATINIHRSDKVRTIKAKIADATRVDARVQRLFYHANVVDDDQPLPVLDGTMEITLTVFERYRVTIYAPPGKYCRFSQL